MGVAEDGRVLSMRRNLAEKTCSEACVLLLEKPGAVACCVLGRLGGFDIRACTSTSSC